MAYSLLVLAKTYWLISRHFLAAIVSMLAAITHINDLLRFGRTMLRGLENDYTCHLKTRAVCDKSLFVLHGYIIHGKFTFVVLVNVTKSSKSFSLCLIY